jgi:hypothetical protein
MTFVLVRHLLNGYNSGRIGKWTYWDFNKFK